MTLHFHKTRLNWSQNSITLVLTYSNIVTQSQDAESSHRYTYSTDTVVKTKFSRDERLLYKYSITKYVLYFNLSQ